MDDHNFPKVITVQIKNVYGVEKIYPISYEAIVFCELLGQKTLTMDDIECIKKLGYKVVSEPNYPQVL